jgi:hypothetical protein
LIRTTIWISTVISLNKLEESYWQPGQEKDR